MSRARALVLALVLLATSAHGAAAVSAVFDGDPRDQATQLPFEILPGQPLVQPGPDGIPGTADDVINPAIVGDIDLVVRAGTMSADPVIPPPALAGGVAALPVGIAGPQNAGGTEIPFTVFLSDGVTAPSEPAGRRLAAADMDGIPVVVAAFADLDRDGVIGPTLHDAVGDADTYLELRELEPVGRAAAIFSGGVAHGSVAIRAGRPASRGGLTVALVAMALTGPFEPAFFEGLIPSGPAIATALPFLPLRDLNRLIRDRPAAAGPASTLQQLIQFAAVPPPDVYTLRLDGSSPTIDAAVVMSQPALRVSFRAGGSAGASEPALEHIALGTRRPADRLNVRIVPVDRFENPADPPADFTVALRSETLQISGQRRHPRPVRIVSPDGRGVLARLVPGTAAGTTGDLRVEHDGIVLAALSFTTDARADRPLADAFAPSTTAPTIQAAVDAASDLNGDGVIAVRVRAGVFREHVVINRPLELVGAGAQRTFLVGDGTTSVLTASAPGAVIRDLTVVGGTRGISLEGNAARIASSAAWRNNGPGVTVTAPAAELWASAVLDNAGGGVALSGTGASCADTVLRGNGGVGVSVQSGQQIEIAGNQVLENNGGGIVVGNASGVDLASNQCVLNIGSGIELAQSEGAGIADNICAANDGDGLRVDRGNGASITGNVLENNNGNGIFLRRTADADFAAPPGVQPPPGDNVATGNRRGDVFIRPD